MKQENERNTKKRLNSLILLVAFTAIMLVVSTYAWFSTNRQVSLTTLTGEVSVVEGIQISLDAKNWTSSIDLSKVDLTATSTDALAGGKTDITYAGNKNIKPKAELVPVSTSGAAGTNQPDLKMYNGVHDGQKSLDTIAEVDTSDVANKEAGYYAFDVFIMNSSKDNNPETLQLDSTSFVKLADATKESSGLQNTVRVGIAKYAPTADLTADDTTVLTTTTGNDKYISDVAIWEPYADKHIAGIVSGNNRLTLSTADKGLWTLASATSVFADGEMLPTYGLTAAAATGDKKIADIYNWDTVPTVGQPDAAPVMARQNTLQTAAPAEAQPEGQRDYTLGKVYDLKSTSAAVKDSTTDFTIEANKISRLRVFLWLEGQDVDCTNFASHGGTVQLDLGLAKGLENTGNPKAPQQ